MGSRKRNIYVLLGVIALFVLALLVAVPGTPLSKPTKLGLDLKGGVELVYEGRPTPKVPKVTPQAVNDAIETIRERVDTLGVSEPEIQSAGASQISIGLPDVDNAARAEEQVGTTAQLQFYDWEPNVNGDPNTPVQGLYDATKKASEQKPKAEPDDIPSGGAKGGRDKAFYDRQNDSTGDKYYLFDKDKQQIGRLPGQPPRTPDANCKELLSDYEKAPGPPKMTITDKTPCGAEIKALGGGGPPAGSQVIKVPRGIIVIRAERPPKLPAGKPQPDNFYVLEDDSELSGSDVTNPKQQSDPQTQEPTVTMDFTDKGRAAFARTTKREADRGSRIILPPGAARDAAFQRFAITLDNQIVSLATIDFRENPEGIDGKTGAQINGVGGFQEANDLANQLRIGALAIDLKLISKTQVSATLGKQALDQGLKAGAAGLILTVLFLLVFYRVLGLVAVGALGMYAVFLIALVKLIPITLTLPGIAGLILTIGVAADANIVIFERVKEEARAGLSIPRAITTGYQKGFRTILDANVVTFLVAFILFMVATAGVKGFAFTLGIGTLVSLFTAVLVTSAILGTMGRTRVLASRGALGARVEREPRKFDFIGRSKYFFSFSGGIIVAGAIAIATLGINFGIDFESGTRIKTPLERPASVAQVREALSPLGLGGAEVQSADEPKLGPNVIQIQTSTLDPARVSQVQQALNAKFGVSQKDFTADSIGPTFGAQIARTALIAIIASLILISVYIGLRFQFKFAVPVMIALAHDILITAGVYALADREVTASTVAALLTILGFSLYDTIIVFDRIRENMPRMPRATFSQIVNRSMSEVLTRSLATSLSTLLPVAALLLFGGQTLKDFAFAILVGIASGAYSSIFIASPVLTEWKEREPAFVRRRRMVMQENRGVVPAYADGAASQGPAPEDAAPVAPQEAPAPVPVPSAPRAAEETTERQRVAAERRARRAKISSENKNRKKHGRR